MLCQTCLLPILLKYLHLAKRHFGIQIYWDSSQTQNQFRTFSFSLENNSRPFFANKFIYLQKCAGAFQSCLCTLILLQTNFYRKDNNRVIFIMSSFMTYGICHGLCTQWCTTGKVMTLSLT